MYLSEMFLVEYEKQKSALKALMCCDQALKIRLNNDLSEENVGKYFFDEENPNEDNHYAELFDFIDIYLDVDYEVSIIDKQRNDIQILNIAEAVEYLYHIKCC
ncbi:MAG: hypothetical protein ACRC3H_19030 [Lachnospiraceae bacterium]